MDETGKTGEKSQDFLKHFFFFFCLFRQPLTDLPGTVFLKNQAEVEDPAVFAAKSFCFQIQKSGFFGWKRDFIRECDDSRESEILKDHRELLYVSMIRFRARLVSSQTRKRYLDE